MKKMILAGVLALAGTCGFAAAGTRVYVTALDSGVTSFLVSPDGSWTKEGKAIDPADGILSRAMAMVRVGATYCVLDSLSTVGKFSIHRYDLAFNYVDTPVREQAIASESSVQQMAASPDGNFLYVTQSEENLIRVDTRNWTVNLSFSTAIANSLGICVTPTGKIYASKGSNFTVSAIDPETGALGTEHHLSQANGVYYDDDAKLVYVGNEAYSLKVFNETDASYTGGTEYSDGTIIQNSRSIVKVGGRICMTRPRDGMIVAFDQATKTFSEVCSTGLGFLYHLCVEEADEAVVTARDGTMTFYATMTEAMQAVSAAGGAASVLFNSTGTRSGRVLFTKPAVDVSGATPLFVSGTCASRALTVVERAAYIASGLNVRHRHVDGHHLVYEWTDSPDVARVFVTEPSYGIRAYRVGFDGTWADEGIVIAAQTGVLARPIAVVRVGAYYYVLDRTATADRFSIHRYNLQYGYVDTLVNAYADNSPYVEQIDASPDGAYLYVTCSSGGSLLRIATKDGSVETYVGNLNLTGLSVTPNGKIYAVNHSNGAATSFNATTGGEMVHHWLSQACGVYYDPDTKSVYVGNLAYDLAVYAETAADWVRTETVYTDDSSIVNSRSITRVGDKICMVCPSKASVVGFDPATGTFSTVCTTGWPPTGTLHVYADDPFSVFGVKTNGAVVAFATFAEAMEAGKDGSLSSLKLAASGYAQRPLQMTNLNVVETAAGLRIGEGTGLSRGLSVAESAAYVAMGCYAKKSVTEGLASFEVAPDGDAACALLTYPAYGVKRYIVTSDGTWQSTNDLFKVGATSCRRPMACLRLGQYYYVLDARSETFGGTFSIWKYSDRGRCRGALVKDAVAESAVFQMAASPDGSKLYVSTQGSPSGEILSVDVATGAVTTFTTAALNGATGICVASGGTVYAANAGNFATTGYNTSGAHIWHLMTGGTVAGVWHDDDMNRLYAMSGGDYFRIFADGQTTYFATVSDSLLSQSHAVAGLGGYVYFGQYFNARLVRYEPETGTLAAVSAEGLLDHATHLYFETLPMPVYPSSGLSVIVK